MVVLNVLIKNENPTICDTGGWRVNDLFRALHRTSLLGKVLRVNINTNTQKAPYKIPRSNPFVCQDGDGRCVGWRPEIFAYGIRNIWRCDMDEGDPVTGERSGWPSKLWNILYKTIVFFQFEIIINVLVSCLRVIWIPMLWVYGRYKYFTLSVRGATLDVGIWRLKASDSDV